MIAAARCLSNASSASISPRSIYFFFDRARSRPRSPRRHAAPSLFIRRKLLALIGDLGGLLRAVGLFQTPRHWRAPSAASRARSGASPRETVQVLGLVDRLGSRADHLYAEPVEYAHRFSDSTRLSAVCPPMVGSGACPGRHLDDAGDDLGGDRLDVGRVGRSGSVMIVTGLIDPDDPVALVLQGLAGLGADSRFAGLSDDDGPAPR